MSRLWRGLWQVEAHRDDGSRHWSPVMEYDLAAVEVAQLGEGGFVRATLFVVPRSRAIWESRAPYEASDPPVWGDE